MINLTAKVDSSELSTWLRKRAEAMDKGLAEVLLEEGSFLLETVTRITPPTDGTLSPSQSWASAKSAGRNAILGDLAKVYVTSASVAAQIREQDADAAKGFGKAVRKGDNRDAQRIMYAYNLGEYATSNIGNFDPSLHKARRNNRGRVRGRTVSQVVRNPAALNQYKREQLAKVGQLKRGWVVSGGKLKRKVKVPAWVLRATGGGSGIMKDMTKRKMNPYLRFSNTSAHAYGSNKAVRFGEKAVQIRTSKVRRSVQHMVKRKWKK
mgnify:CR=1 FL=1